MDLLDTFIGNARANLAEGYYRHREDAREATESGPRLSLAQRVSAQGFSLIAEIKHASPAGEYAFDRIDVAATAEAFRECGADAISVVVEPKTFKGSLAHVPLAKKAGLPVLFKDFVISPEQIRAAREVGADALLLVVKVATRLGLDLDALVEEAHREGLEVLLESYDEREMLIALETEADLLGINNRDLETLKVDITRTQRILASVRVRGRPVISESGIRTGADARFAREAGARGVLVGTAIWKAPDLRAKVRELKRGGADG